MAKKCQICGKKLPFLYSDTICKTCKKKLENLYETSKNEIINKKIVELEKLRDLKIYYNKEQLIKFYNFIYNKFEQDNELDENEIDILKKIQDFFELSNDEIKFNEKILPYLYIYEIKQNNKLPDLTFQLDNPEINKNFGKTILKKGEKVHYFSYAILKEMRSVSLGYQGGSQGISIRIAKGVRYRVGAHKGHIVRENKLVETSKGLLLITNKRLFLQPQPGFKPVSIPLGKIISYHVFENGIEIYKEGRQKGYFFISGEGNSETFGICLEFLLSN